MFSPATKKSNFQYRNANTSSSLLAKFSNPTLNDSPGSPATPLHESNAVLNRPSTGTPAPWASRLSVLARIPSTCSNEKGEELNQIQPVHVGEFPSLVRDEQQAILQQMHAPGDMGISGGMDRETSLAWIICRSKFFIWSYLSQNTSRGCVVLDIPSSALEKDVSNKSSSISNDWLVCVLNWDSSNNTAEKVVARGSSAGILLCNKKSRTIFYWPDIYSKCSTGPVISYGSIEESVTNSSPGHRKSISSQSRHSYINSLIASPASGDQHVCLALACSSNGELWQFYCQPFQIQRKIMPFQGIYTSQSVESKGYPRSLTWNFSHTCNGSKRQFLFFN